MMSPVRCSSGRFTALIVFDVMLSLKAPLAVARNRLAKSVRLDKTMAKQVQEIRLDFLREGVCRL
jgi:hypothetical protein